MLWIILWVLILAKLFTILTHRRCTSKVCLVGKTALITGGYSGLGFETALNLASRGCRVIIADMMDLTRTKEDIILETNNPNIVIKHVDFQSFKSVRELAKDINETEPRLDILINNVGIANKKMIVTEDGLSKTLQVNYFSHVLLTHLLIGLLKKSVPSRIIFLSSALAYFSKTLTVDLLTNTKPNLNEWKLEVGAYGDSKVLLDVASVVLARKLKGSGVTANAVHPGYVSTNIYTKALKFESNIFIRIGSILAKVVGKNIEEGSHTIIYAACDKKVEEVSGKYFLECMAFFHPWQVYDRKFCKDIWDATERIIGLEEHEKL